MNLRQLRHRLRHALNDRLFHRLLKNSGILLSGNIGASILGFATITLTARSLGTEGFGLLVLITTYALIIDRLVNFQSWQALIKFGAEALAEGNEGRLKSLFKFGALLDVSSALFGTLFGIGLIYFLQSYLEWDEEAVELAALYCLTIMFNVCGMPTAVLRLFNRFRAFAIQNVVAAGLKLFGVLVAVYAGGELRFFVWAWLIATIFGYLLLILQAYILLSERNLSDWFLSPIEDWKPPLKFALSSNLVSAIDLPVKQLDMVLVATVISIEATGIYKIIKKVVDIFGRLADPLYQAVFPDFAHLIAAGEHKRAFALSLKTGLLLFGALFLPILILALAAPLFLEFFFGSDYIAGASALSIFLVLKLISLSFITIHPLFIALGHIHKNLAIIFLTNTLYVLAILIFGSALGLQGVVIAFAINSFLNILIKLAIIRHGPINKLGDPT